MTLAIARRYPGVIRRVAFVRRTPLVRSEAQCVNPNPGLNNGLSAGLNQSMPALPLRLKNGYATQAKTGTGRATTAKKSASKSTTKPKTTKSRTTKTKTAKPKKKTTTARKTVAKRKTTTTTRGRPKKQLTAQEKEDETRKALKRRIKALKQAALSPPKRLPERVMGLYVSEASGSLVDRVKSFKSVSESEVSRLTEMTKSNAQKNNASYEQWVNTHSPLEIRNANLARASLRRLKYHPRVYSPIKDERQVSPPLPPYGFFMRESAAAGEMDGLTVPQAGARMGQMWRNMSENEKNKYRQMSQKDRDRYIGEFKAQYHQEPPMTRVTKKKTA